MISFQEWRNKKLIDEMMFNPNGPPSATKFFSNMNFKPGSIRKVMIRKKDRKAVNYGQAGPPLC